MMNEEIKQNRITLARQNFASDIEAYRAETAKNRRRLKLELRKKIYALLNEEKACYFDFTDKKQEKEAEFQQNKKPQLEAYYGLGALYNDIDEQIFLPVEDCSAFIAPIIANANALMQEGKTQEAYAFYASNLMAFTLPEPVANIAYCLAYSGGPKVFSSENSKQAHKNFMTIKENVLSYAFPSKREQYENLFDSIEFASCQSFEEFLLKKLEEKPIGNANLIEVIKTYIPEDFSICSDFISEFSHFMYRANTVTAGLLSGTYDDSIFKVKGAEYDVALVSPLGGILPPIALNEREDRFLKIFGKVVKDLETIGPYCDNCQDEELRAWSYKTYTPRREILQEEERKRQLIKQAAREKEELKRREEEEKQKKIKEKEDKKEKVFDKIFDKIIAITIGAGILSALFKMFAELFNP